MSHFMQNDRNRDIARSAAILLADSYALYLKTHNYHWNVTGPMFNTLHTMFQAQYEELALAVDDVAERIRTLGSYAPGSFREFGELSSLADAVENTSAVEMIKQLAADQLLVAESARKLGEVADSAGDDVTVDLAIRRQDVHQKNAWMLHSHLD
ncbi:MAG: Dps family protein [Candidatus Krumholzibacteriota bacterium]